MSATMSIIVNEGHDRPVYPGASVVKFSSALPEYQGGVTMTLRFTPKIDSAPLTSSITVNPDTNGGVPCVGGGRWPIAHLLQKLASGLASEQLIQENPDLTLADIQLALDAAAWVMRDPTIDWATLDLSGMADFQHEMQAWQSLSDEILEQTTEA